MDILPKEVLKKENAENTEKQINEISINKSIEQTSDKPAEESHKEEQKEPEQEDKPDKEFQKEEQNHQKETKEEQKSQEDEEEEADAEEEEEQQQQNNENVSESLPTLIIQESIIPFTHIHDGEYSRSIISYQEKGVLKVHICAYAINLDCMIEGIQNDNPNISNKNFVFNKKIPFLQFVFKKDEQSQKYAFPHFEHQIPNVQEPNEDESKSQIDINFESECFKQLFEYFTCDEPILEEYTKCNNPNIDKASILEHYKGYIEHDDGIVVLFDISTWIRVLKKEYTLAIVNEILHKKRIFNTECEQFVFSFFKKNIELTQLHNTDGSIIPYPFQVYMCELKQSGSDGNVDNMQSMKISEEIRGFIKPLFHSKLGYSYYFNNTLEDESQFENLQRVAIFVVNSLYILEEINDFDLSQEENITNFSEASTIYFHENEIQLWSIRNINHYVLY
jgi:hypothetical protein